MTDLEALKLLHESQRGWLLQVGWLFPFAGSIGIGRWLFDYQSWTTLSHRGFCIRALGLFLRFESGGQPCNEIQLSLGL